MKSAWTRANAAWLHDAQWGVMLHYLAGQPSADKDVAITPEEWNRRVEAVDVGALAATLAGAGAGYLVLTLGQNSGFYCSPNATYDRVVGATPSRLSRRDLLGEMADAGSAVGLRVIAYLPSHAPCGHRQAVEALGFAPVWDASKWGLKPGSYTPRQGVDERLTDAQRNWESVIREWSLRWGRTVSGWWIDGCYYADRMYRHEDEPNFRSFASALKAGNPDAIVAFNSGVVREVRPTSAYDDYTAGEMNDLWTASGYHPMARWVDGAQFQLLSFLGSGWRTGAPRYPDDLVRAYTHYIHSLGGAMTWDVPVDEAGRIPEPFVRQLQHLGA